MTTKTDYDVIIIGAGAAGLMCAMTAGKRGKKVLVLDHAEKIAEKIRISGGGRCNFTNIASTPKNFISENPRFCISALKRFTPVDFIKIVDSHNIRWFDKGAGQLFCEKTARDIVKMLLDECAESSAKIQQATKVIAIEKPADHFQLFTAKGPVSCNALVIATGGLSIPKVGATGFGHTIARQFGHTIIDPRPGLVPLTFSGERLDALKNLSGVSLEAQVTSGKTSFTDALLFTHRGLSGPAILQISSYWKEAKPIVINLLPGVNCLSLLKDARNNRPRQQVSTFLGSLLPTRLADYIAGNVGAGLRLADTNNATFEKIATAINNWQILPQGTEGYRTAEVTLGGVNTKELSSKTMQSTLVSNLYFIGEVLDVTGHLGGHNFQWAWASGHAAGSSV